MLSSEEQAFTKLDENAKKSIIGPKNVFGHHFHLEFILFLSTTVIYNVMYR